MSLPKFSDFRTTRDTSKLWIDPDNQVIQLISFHYEYFRDHPEESKKWGVVFRDEQTTRLDALCVGFVRINYARQGGRLTIETFRWDRMLRNLIDRLVLENEDSIDIAHIHKIDKAGQTVQLGCTNLMDFRMAGIPINRMTLGSWSYLKVTKI